MTKLNIALIGYGRMGRNHARVIRETADAHLAFVVDPTADLSNPGFLHRLPESSGSVDAFVVAAATEAHFQIGMDLLKFGRPVLMEKPVAASLDDAERLAKAYEDARIPLAVGHLERFNPAVRKLKEVIDAGWIGEPIHFSATRVGGYPNSVNPSNNVLVDLAVHDLDVLNHLVGPLEIDSAVGHQSWKQGVIDTAEILARTRSGISASLHVNWITPTKIRTLRVTGTKGVCFVDYILQTCVLMGGNLLKGRPSEDYDFQSLLEAYRNTDRLEFGVMKEEPLKSQLQEFIKLVRGLPSDACRPGDANYAVKAAREALDRATRKA